MTKMRRIVAGIAWFVYLSLFLMKIDIPKNVFISLLLIILINQAIDEWNNYKETKRKVHLLIPVTALLFCVYGVLILIYKTLNK
ncbi:hypothetical protein [Tissierella creatinophila]|uniref:Group-specific protein n=1 Tax=Tissierella creatinophila DSM 6911 TaxID=1123403 RepID=A0A1U7M6K0_TISCR|nr:hypothetical protein [Tissierella creatinophila]OLS02954.1 hypothetical protein TICRE_10110 [Tissierella creatinophila DSM 6911]